MVDRLMKILGNEQASFDALQKADPQQLAKFIHSEHPQTIALILSHLNPSQAAGLLFSLPGDMRADVALRMANLDQISPEIISKIADDHRLEIEIAGRIQPRSLRRRPRRRRDVQPAGFQRPARRFWNRSTTPMPGLGETIRHLMFVFEDLLLLILGGDQGSAGQSRPQDSHRRPQRHQRSAEELISCSAMSQRGAEMLREDMEALGPVKIKEVEAAQQQIIAVVRQLESEGVISLKGAVGEQYVV